MGSGIATKIKTRVDRRTPVPTTTNYLSFHITHRWADPGKLELYTRIPARKIRRAAQSLDGVEGCVALLTCHRSELYVEASHPEMVKTKIRDYFQSPQFHATVRNAGDEFRPTSDLRVMKNSATVRHLLRVAAGLDSALVGESEILGQVRRALHEAERDETCTPALARLFQRAIATGRRVRAETGLAFPFRSVGGATLAVLRHRLGALRDKRLLLVGAGDAARSVAAALARVRPRRLVILNRTQDKAESLANKHRADAGPLSGLATQLPHADAAVIAIRATRPLFTRTRLRKITQDRSNPLVLIDLSQPPVVERDGPIPNVEQLSLNDVLDHANTTSSPDRSTLARAENLVATIAKQFDAECSQTGNGAGLLLRRLNEEAEHLTQRELEHALRRMPGLPARHRAVVEELARSIRTKLLMRPTLALKLAADQGEPQVAEDVLRLFDVDAPRAQATKTKNGSRRSRGP